MVTTCKVVSEIKLDGTVIASRIWETVDVMNMSATRAWTTKLFNASRKAAQSNQIIVARWDAYYGAPYHTHLSGLLSGVNGMVQRRGIFEC
jgi:hypothetical protein